MPTRTHARAHAQRGYAVNNKNEVYSGGHKDTAEYTAILKGEYTSSPMQGDLAEYTATKRGEYTPRGSPRRVPECIISAYNTRRNHPEGEYQQTGHKGPFWRFFVYYYHNRFLRKKFIKTYL